MGYVKGTDQEVVKVAVDVIEMTVSDVLHSVANGNIELAELEKKMLSIGKWVKEIKRCSDVS